MFLEWQRRALVRLAAASLCSFAAGRLAADVITLNAGGVVQGKMIPTGNADTVALQTSVGTLLVFDRAAVKSVKHGPSSPQKAQSVKSGSGKKAPKQQLTAEEKAWFPKVRRLVERLYGSDRDDSRRANSELLNIDDPNAVPAL